MRSDISWVAEVDSIFGSCIVNQFQKSWRNGIVRREPLAEQFKGAAEKLSDSVRCRSVEILPDLYAVYECLNQELTNLVYLFALHMYTYNHTCEILF